MNNRLLIAPLLLSAVLLAACSSETQSNLAETIKTDVAKDIDKEIAKAIVDVKNDMTDISIRLKDGREAKIAANGDLSIAGKAVTLTAEQRELTTQYFQTTKTIALQGIEIGKESAKLATKAIGSAIGGIISGQDEKAIEQTIEAETGNIKAVAIKLCDSADALNGIQKKLSASLPEFDAEPMQVERNADGCNVNGDGVNIDTSTSEGDKALTADEAAKK
jgi:Protein of unknown function (DUF2884)